MASGPEVSLHPLHQEQGTPGDHPVTAQPRLSHPAVTAGRLARGVVRVRRITGLDCGVGMYHWIEVRQSFYQCDIAKPSRAAYRKRIGVKMSAGNHSSPFPFFVKLWPIHGLRVTNLNQRYFSPSPREIIYAYQTTVPYELMTCPSQFHIYLTWVDTFLA